MFRTYKPQSPRKVSRKKHLPDEQTPALSLQSSHPTLQMQSLIGNHATQRMIQRMPTAGVIETTLGKPKADQTIGIGRLSTVKKNATKYRAVLKAVTDYDNFVEEQLATGKGAIQAQFRRGIDLLDAIIRVASVYDPKDNKKARYMKNTLKPEALKEKTNVATSLASILNNQALQGTMKNYKLKAIIRKAPTHVLLDKDVVGKDRGGASEVTKFGGKAPGYFKQNKEKLANWGDGENDKPDFLNAATKDIDDDVEKALVKNALGVEKDIGVDVVGIDPNNAHMANRDVAMSRLDQLLGAEVIAKAEIAVRHTSKGEKTGSLMEDASKKGKSAFDLATAKEYYDSSKGEVQGAPKHLNLQDPELMRRLSRLQLIDLLAFQVDRNTKNYFVEVDAAGQVTGVTGIDNDLSMGTNEKNDKRNMELPGFSRYVDEELATAILNLDVEILKALMADLLSESEINALLGRLKKLQAFLQPLKDAGQLLKPNQWTPAIAQDLLNERPPKSTASKNYYSQFIAKVKGQSSK